MKGEKLFQSLWGVSCLYNPPSVNTWDDCSFLGCLETPWIEKDVFVTFKYHVRNSVKIDILGLLNFAWRFVSPRWETRRYKTSAKVSGYSQETNKTEESMQLNVTSLSCRKENPWRRAPAHRCVTVSSSVSSGFGSNPVQGQSWQDGLGKAPRSKQAGASTITITTAWQGGIRLSWGTGEPGRIRQEFAWLLFHFFPPFIPLFSKKS